MQPPNNNRDSETGLPPTTPKPKKFYSLLVFDLDGTWTPTYENLPALLFLAKAMALTYGDRERIFGPKAVTGAQDRSVLFRQASAKLCDEEIFSKDSMLSGLNEKEKEIFLEIVNYVKCKPELVGFILHRPERALKHIETTLLLNSLKESESYKVLPEEQRSNALKRVKLICKSHLDKDVQACIEASFKAYSGDREILDRCKEAGTKVCLYTKTSIRFAIGTGDNPGLGRLQRAGITPDDIDAIYFYSKSLEKGNKWLEEHKNNPFVREGKVRFYTQPKPNFQPIEKMMDEFGASPENTLFFGESTHDFECVLSDRGCVDECIPLKVDFAFHKAGAEDAGRVAAINRLLRDHTIGLAEFEKYPWMGEHPDIMMLDRGFRTFIDGIGGGYDLTSPVEGWRPQAGAAYATGLNLS